MPEYIIFFSESSTGVFKMQIDMEATGKKIMAFRKKLEIPISGIQKACGFQNPQAIYKWQRGESLPSIDNLVILARLFSTTIDEILVVQE